MTQEEIMVAIESLKELEPLDVGSSSSERIAQIARCIYEPSMGWTRGACESLRTRLIGVFEAALEYESAGLDAMGDDELAEAGLLRLPKDKNGEVIQLGDVVVNECGNMYEVKQVTYGTYHGGPRWTVTDRYGEEFETDELRHHCEVTVEDVLHEFLGRYCAYIDGGEVNTDDLVSEYAAKAREAVRDE